MTSHFVLVILFIEFQHTIETKLVNNMYFRHFTDNTKDITSTTNLVYVVTLYSLLDICRTKEKSLLYDKWIYICESIRLRQTLW